MTTTVSGAGGFKVEVRMEDCEKDPCRYGLGVWGKRSSASPSQAAGRMSRVAPGTSSTASAAPRKAASAPDFNAAPSYGTITLSAGFEPDPSLRSISAGGADQTSLGGDCSGFINAAAPDLDLNYTKGSYKLYIYAKSSSDITLIVNQPDGTWICNDDVNGSNPGLTIDNPQSGNYNIWIGTFEASRTPLPEAIVYFSESEPRW